MVKNMTALGRNGVHDFILVRASAIILTFYTLYLIGFFVLIPEINYGTWTSFWAQTSTKVFTMLALASLLMHGWIGMWQITTDYIKSTIIRGLTQFTIISFLFTYFFVGLFVFWGV